MWMLPNTKMDVGAALSFSESYAPSLGLLPIRVSPRQVSLTSCPDFSGVYCSFPRLLRLQEWQFGKHLGRKETRRTPQGPKEGNKPGFATSKDPSPLAFAFVSFHSTDG